MHSLHLLALFISPSLHVLAFPSSLQRNLYSRAHYLGDNYHFNPQDGWKSANISNSHYNYLPTETTNHYARDDNHPHHTHNNKSIPQSKEDTHSRHHLSGVLSTIFSGLKGLGTPERAIITWYTGNDLKNPSCWPNGNWAPTDQSFACALTERGWIDRPKCLEFLELCNTQAHCIFVRVVDSCAGCDPGTHHIDLTRAAFRELASLDQGVLTISYRKATCPSTWFKDLWGPKDSC